MDHKQVVFTVDAVQAFDLLEVTSGATSHRLFCSSLIAERNQHHRGKCFVREKRKHLSVSVEA